MFAALLAATPAPLAAQAAGEPSAVPDRSCGRACLLGHLDSFMDALAVGDATRLPLAADLVFTENNVPISSEEGLWGTVTAVDEVGLEAADPVTGNAAWFGSVKENGKPAIFAVRIHVTRGLIDEIESVVHRKTALPAPFGNVETMVHDKEFNEILPPEQRRSRERMHTIGDAYFDTVQVNDGQVFAPFAEDCGRLENGISTTAPTPGSTGGNAAALSAGCLNQFKLGLYRINKRIRRDIFIIDEERGVVVARGFFDHANEWDRYKLTDGREMRTALKWPNSITLIEAFRIKNAEIQRIEAVFTYVPYFMHNPFWGPASKPPEYAPRSDVCDDACLDANARAAVKAMAGNHWQGVDWAGTVGYAENSVGIRVGEGIWAGVSAVDDKPLVIADAETGKAVWIGKIEEHGQPAWAAMIVSSDGKKVGGIEALIRRKEYGAPYTEPTAAPSFAELPKTQRTGRAEMLGTVDRFYDALNAHQAKVPEGLSDKCQWIVNGQVLGACAAPLAGNSLQWIARWRDRQMLAVDEARGLVAVQFFEDIPSVPRSFAGQDGTARPNVADYPRSLQIVEVFRFVGGKVEQLTRFSSELPYGMKPHR